MDTEKAVPDTESYQERLSFCVQILSFFTTNFIGHCAVVQNCWFFKKKKKNSIICTTTLTSQVV